MAMIFVTGSTDGLGRAAAQVLISAGHHVVLHARSLERASSLGELAPRAATVVLGDLRIAEEVRRLADQVNAMGTMDAVIHNAGVYREPTRNPTPEGHATVLAVNTLAPYILTASIRRPQRLIYLSSSLHLGGEGSLGDLDWLNRPWNAGQAYAESKLHVAALAAALARRWPKVISSAVDPGWVRTRMGGAGAPVDIDTGQRTQSWLATSEDPAALVSGGYWRDQRREQPAKEVNDPSFQAELLVQLEGLTGIALP